MEDSKAPKRNRPEPATDAQFNADAEYGMKNFIRNDGQKMIRAAQKFLEEAKKRCGEYEINEETGEWEPVTKAGQWKKYKSE